MHVNANRNKMTSNTKCRRFWSAFPDPRAEAYDALAQSWTGRRLFINPPFALAQQVVTKLCSDLPRSAIVVLPEWPGSTWHAQLTRHPALQATCLLHPADAVEHGPYRNLAEPLRNPRWLLRAWSLAWPQQAATSLAC